MHHPPPPPPSFPLSPPLLSWHCLHRLPLASLNERNSRGGFLNAPQWHRFCDGQAEHCSETGWGLTAAEPLHPGKIIWREEPAELVLLRRHRGKVSSLHSAQPAMAPHLCLISTSHG